MADFYVYDPAANEYVGPIKEFNAEELNIQDCDNFSYCKEPDGTWTADFHGAKFTVEFHGTVDFIPKTEWVLYLLIGQWTQDISEHGGTL